MRILSRTLLTALLLALPVEVFAFGLPGGWDAGVCAYVNCPAGGGVAGLANYIATRFIGALELAFIGIGIIMLLISTINMVLRSSEESAVSEARSSYYYLIIGAAVVSFAHVIARTFFGHGEDLVNPNELISTVNGSIIKYFRLILGVAFAFNLVLQAIRLVNSQGEQEQIDRARKRMIASVIGVALILLMGPILQAISPGANSGVFNPEIVGIARYLLTILGALAVLTIIVAGILLVVSINDQLKDRAKTMIKTAIIVLIVIILAYAIVTTSAKLPRGPSP